MKRDSKRNSFQINRLRFISQRSVELHTKLGLLEATHGTSYPAKYHIFHEHAPAKKFNEDLGAKNEDLSMDSISDVKERFVTNIY